MDTKQQQTKVWEPTSILKFVSDDNRNKFHKTLYQMHIDIVSGETKWVEVPTITKSKAIAEGLVDNINTFFP